MKTCSGRIWTNWVQLARDGFGWNPSWNPWMPTVISYVNPTNSYFRIAPQCASLRVSLRPPALPALSFTFLPFSVQSALIGFSSEIGRRSYDPCKIVMERGTPISAHLCVFCQPSCHPQLHLNPALAFHLDSTFYVSCNGATCNPSICTWGQHR